MIARLLWHLGISHPARVVTVAGCLALVGLTVTTCTYRDRLHRLQRESAIQAAADSAALRAMTAHIRHQQASLDSARTQTDGTTVVLRERASVRRQAPVSVVRSDSGRFTVTIPPDTTPHVVPMPVAQLVEAYRQYVVQDQADHMALERAVDAHLAADVVERRLSVQVIAEQDTALVLQRRRISWLEAQQRKRTVTVAVVAVVSAVLGALAAGR